MKQLELGACVLYLILEL